MGLLVAAGAYLKSTVLVIPLFVAAALLPRLSLRSVLLRCALAFGLPILALVPWAARNQQLFHRPILTSTFFWPTIWEGFGEVPNPFGAVLDDRLTYLETISRQKNLVYGTPSTMTTSDPG